MEKEQAAKCSVIWNGHMFHATSLDEVVFILLSTLHINFSPVPVIKTNIAQLSGFVNGDAFETHSNMTTQEKIKRSNLRKKFNNFKKSIFDCNGTTNRAKLETLYYNFILSLEGHSIFVDVKIDRKGHKINYFNDLQDQKFFKIIRRNLKSHDIIRP